MISKMYLKVLKVLIRPVSVYIDIYQLLLLRHYCVRGTVTPVAAHEYFLQCWTVQYIEIHHILYTLNA